MNNMKQQRLGQTFINKFGTPFKIVVYTHATDLMVEFQDEYKTRVHTNYKSCVTGSVRNPYDKTLCGVAYLGVGYTTTQQNGQDSREYKLWKAMIERCYSNKSTTYKDCVVCERWLCFSNFLQDLPNIENYELWKQDKRFELDKDIKGNSKLYSLETCKFVTHTENAQEMLNRRGNPTDKKAILATHIDTSQVFEFESVTDAAQKLDIHRTNISACISGRQKTAKGFKFELKNKEE